MVQSFDGDNDVEQAVSGSCPIPRTHDLLSDSHWYWHQALLEYADPRGFRASLNSLIQALRNVTWVLQSEKRGIPDFDTWYAGWQQRLRSDPVLRWLVDARNATVKRGDLKTRSRARVALTFDWAGERAVTHIDVPPLMRTEDIPNAVRIRVPEGVRGSSLVRIDRQWVADTLPDCELLDALGHCYGMIATVVGDAHRQANADLDTTHPHETSRPRGDDGRLGCMISTEDNRTVVLNLQTGDILQPSSAVIPADHAAMARAAKRYGLEAPPELKNDPFAFAQQCVEQAKKVISRDKYHLPFVWLFHPGGLEMIVMPAEDRQQKFFGWERVSREVRQLGATALVSVAETWLAPIEDARRGIPPSRSKRKKEAIDVTVASIDGRSRTYLTVFRRRFGRIVFESTAVSEGAGFFLQPVRRVWNEMSASTAT